MMKPHKQTRRPVRWFRRALLCSLFAMLLPSLSRQALTETNEQGLSDRKIVTRVEPEYPETLKRLYVGGVVRVEVVVDANGKVESAQLLGGNPILGQSAMKAVKQWKYAPAAAKEKFVVRLEFDPHR